MLLPAVQGWLGLGLAITQDLKDPSAPKSLPSQKQLKFRGGVQTHKKPVLLERVGNVSPGGSSSLGGVPYFTLQTMCLLLTARVPLAPVPIEDRRTGLGRP